MTVSVSITVTVTVTITTFISSVLSYCSCRAFAVTVTMLLWNCSYGTIT